MSLDVAHVVAITANGHSFFSVGVLGVLLGTGGAGPLLIVVLGPGAIRVVAPCAGVLLQGSH